MATADRLAAYYKAETEILEAQELRRGDRTFRMAELQEVRRAIKDLERQLYRERAKKSIRYKVANLS